MATALQQQLAAISAKSTNQLNLKAQKERHSQSLLFEPREAASQTFDTLYQICLAGFTELCQVDRRFQAFSKSLFAESSVSVEREHLTAKENEELDAVVEQFLGLVSGRLLLRPAYKSLEWLIRRWKIHEHNSASLVYAFLPYHNHESFPTVLSLLPKKLPSALLFLKPYIASLQSPPRHVLASAAAGNQAFLSEYTTFVLGTASRKQQSSIMLGLWASIVARAVNSMLDAAQSGRQEVRRQKMEDVMTKILPILQDTLAISSSQELFLAACIIATLLASRGQLVDSAIDALMESITNAWSTNTLQEAIECLALLAQEKDEATLPRTVSKAIIRTDGALDALLTLQSRLKTDNIVTGVLARAFHDLKAKPNDDRSASIVHDIVTKGVLSEQTKLLIRNSIPALAQSGTTFNVGELQAVLNLDPLEDGMEVDEDKDVLMIDGPASVADEPEAGISSITASQVDALKADLPTLPTEFQSFLDRTYVDSRFFERYAAWFDACCTITDEDVLSELSSIPNLDTVLETGSRTLSFLAAFWCSSDHSKVAKLRALEITGDVMISRKDGIDIDWQVLYPSLLLALSDPVPAIRRATAQLFATLSQMLTQTEAVVWAADSIYGQRSENLVLLGREVYISFFQSTIASRLEDCILDPTVVQSAIIDWLNQPLKTNKHAPSLCEAFASHAVTDGRSRIATLFLGMLAKVGKNATSARQTVLAPFLGHVLHLQSTDDPLVVQLAIKCLTHRSPEELDTLQRLADEGGPRTLFQAFKQLSTVFESAKSNDQKALLSWLMDQAVSTGDGTVDSEDRSAAASDSLRNANIPIDVLAHQLSILPSKAYSQDVRPAKKARIQHVSFEKAPAVEDRDQLRVQISLATICMELIEDALHAKERNKSAAARSVQDLSALFKGLFNLLVELQSWRSSTGSDFSYLQSLTLANMAAVLTEAGSAVSEMDTSIMRTDLIVDTLRSTSSPQVHNNALLLISKVATLAPDTVLHSVMPLFTFMSSSTLRQADAYSAHVITMTIESIVPPLVSSLKKRGRDLITGASDLLLSFIAAYEHMPSHRRLDTFVQLIRTLGADDSLHAVLAMLVERYENDVTLPSTLHGMMSSFSVDTQVNAVTSYLRLVIDACKKRRTSSNAILGFGEKNAAEAHASVATLLDGLATILQDGEMRRKIAVQMRKEASARNLRQSYQISLGLLVGLPDIEGNAINFDEPGVKRTHGEALQALLHLLPVADFIDSSAILMQTGTEAVRTKVFASLTTRVQDTRTGDTAMAKVFLDALPNCAAFLASSQPIAVRRAALTCVDAISEKFGRLDRDAVSNVVKIITGPAALASDSTVLQTASMLCLASAVEVLGDAFAGLSSNSVQQSLDHVQASLAARSVDWKLVEAAFTFLNALLDHEPWLLSNANVLDRAVVLACTAGQMNTSSWPADDFRELVSKKISLPVINATLLNTFDDVLRVGSGAIAQLVRLQHAVVQFHTKKEILKNADSFQKFVLRAFEIREALTAHDANAAQDVDKQAQQLAKACAETTQSTLDLTLKLNDVSFRPFFMQLVDQAGQTTNRAIALYDYTAKLFEQLGSIVTSYASYILEHASDTLKQAALGDLSDEQELLLVRVLATLSASFRHDQDDFWTASSHFEAIMEPLLKLLTLRLTDASITVKDVILDLAAAVSSSPELLKVMNTELMLLLRDQDSEVRLAAVKSQRAITERLTFDWLNLLPEMLPFISELLEDDDEAVEREALRWVSQLEEVTGESLEGMLA